MDNDNITAILAHAIGPAVAWLGLGWVAPLVIWLVKKDESEYISHHARQALGFQLTALIALVVCFPLLFILIGFVLMPVVYVIVIVFAVLACIAAAKGEEYDYPKWTMIPFPFVKNA